MFVLFCALWTEVGILFQFPPCYKDMSFWISDTFTENNLCEVVRGIAGDLVEEVYLYMLFLFLIFLLTTAWLLGIPFPVLGIPTVTLDRDLP